MKTDPRSQKRDSNNMSTSNEDIRESVMHFHSESNTSDGSEFLDDAIRMKDQPLEEPSNNENQETEF